MKNKNNKIFKFIGYGVISVFVILLIFIGSFFLTSYSPSSNAISSLEDTPTVDVNEGKLITFTPLNTSPTTGLIIYPGAKVKPEAYAPLANKIAQAGYQVVITPMPFNFAIFNSNAANDVIEEFPNIKNWAISGHSLGGVMASKYASENNEIKGLLLLASYPTNDALKNTNIQVASIYGSNDGVADIQKILDSKNLLPTNSTFVEIDGGNHAQFGSYGVQKGDNSAMISEDNQTNITVDASISLLEKISQ